MPVVAIDEADDIGKIGKLHLLCRLGRERIEFRRVFISAGFDGGGNVLIAEVQDREAECLRLAGDGAGDVRTAQRESSRGPRCTHRMRCGARGSRTAQSLQQRTRRRC